MRSLLFAFLIVIIIAVALGNSKPLGGRIIGGVIAFAGEFPYAAALSTTTSSGSYFCAGSILSNQWILTAAQCASGVTLFTITVGTTKLDGADSTTQKLATDTSFVHPDYNEQTLENDIALVKFREPIQFTSYIRQIYLPYGRLSDGAVGVTFGWGQVSDTDAGLASTLRYVTLSALSTAECKVSYGNQITENMICFGGNFNEGTCFGDSGSPIIQHSATGYTVVAGVASFFSSKGCESPDPSGYTEVYPYNSWIENITGISTPNFAQNDIILQRA